MEVSTCPRMVAASLESHSFPVEQNEALPRGFDEQQVVEQHLVEQHLVAGYRRCVCTAEKCGLF